MKRVGTIKGIAVYEDPECPPGLLYFLHERNFYKVMAFQLSRWQKVKLWIRRLLNKLS